MTIVAIVGRPNVGKSTLFNRITRSRRALVDDMPGVTRDRNYAQVSLGDKSFTLIDTGGFVTGRDSSIQEHIRQQVLIALEEADVILFVTDGRAGMNPEDAELADRLRRAAKPIYHVVNKVDGPEHTPLLAEFYELGVDRLYGVSAAHGYGVRDLLADLARSIPDTDEGEAADKAEAETAIRIAVLGRPNVGKSTLVNRLLGVERVIVSPTPGTTRDAVDSALEHNGQSYVLVDTAGIRRKGRVSEKLEKVSVLKGLLSIERCHLGVLLIDTLEGLTEQDLHIGGYILERRRGCIIAVNKWDRMDRDPKRIKQFLDYIRDRFRFLPHAPILTLSALTGRGVNKVLPTAREIFYQYNSRITTGVVNRVLGEALERHEPPLVAGRRLKFYYATQASTRPPSFVLFCNRPDSIHFSYERFLTNQFREAFGFDKTPIRLIFRPRKKMETAR